MGSFTLPPGWSTAPPQGQPPPVPGAAPAGVPLPPGWSTTPPSQAPGSGVPGVGGGGDSLSDRWAGSEPRRMGVLKSLLNTLVGVYDLPGQAAGTLTDLMLNREAQPRMTARQALQPDPSNPSAPTIVPTEAEQPAYMAGSLAQFLAPTPAGKTAAAGYVADAGLTALMTQLQGGSGGDVVESGVWGGASRPLLGLLGRGVVATIGKASDKGKQLSEFLAERMKESALHGYKEVLKPTTRENKAITQRIAPELIERGVTGLTRERMLADAAGKVERFGGQVDDAIAALPKDAKIQTKPILDHMSSAKAEFKTGEQAVRRQVPTGVLDESGNPIMRTVTDMVPIYADRGAVRTIDGLANIVARHGDTMTPDQIIKLRRIFDNQIAQAKGFHGKTLREGTEIEAKRELTGAIRAELAKEFPDLAKVNREFSFWSNVEKVLGETVERAASQSKPLGEQVSRAGVVGGVVASGVEPAAAIAGGVAVGLKRLTASTAWKTYGAVFKDRLATAIASQNFDEAMRLINQGLAGSVSAGSRP